MFTVYLSHRKLEGSVEINDSTPISRLDSTKDYFLRITTGKYTIKAFYSLYFLKKDVRVSTTNLEYLIFRIQSLRSVRLVVVEDVEEGKDVEEDYGPLEKEILKKSNTSLSLSPNIYGAILSSLKRPSLYSSTYPSLEEILSGKNESHLKSLLFTRILLKTPDGFILNPLLDASL